MDSELPITLTLTTPDEQGDYELVFVNVSSRTVHLRHVHPLRELHVSNAAGVPMRLRLIPFAIKQGMWRLRPGEERRSKRNVPFEFIIEEAGEYDIWVDFDNRKRAGIIKHPAPELEDIRTVTTRVRFKVTQPGFKNGR